MKKFLMMAVAMVMIGGSCYSVGHNSVCPSCKCSSERAGKCFNGKNKAIRDVRNKLWELKKFKIETVRENLKIDSRELGNIISGKIHALGLSNKTFDHLRKSAKSDLELMRINKLQNKFLRFNMMVRVMSEGCPRLEKGIHRVKSEK
jgi:hypothetical protein